MKLIVTCGGQGTKLWPYSREDRPKQFQQVVGDKSLLRQKVETLLKEFKPEDIYFSTKERYFDLVKIDAPEISPKQIIMEPNAKKNQGPGTIYAVLKIAQDHPDEPFVLVQSDCVRRPDDKFLEFLFAEEKLIKKTKRLVTGGIRPMFPDMGCDYLRLGDSLERTGDIKSYAVSEFIMRLKDVEKTKELISGADVLVHTNHYGWYPDLLMAAVEKIRPDWHEIFVKIKSGFGRSDEKAHTQELYETLEAGPIEEITKKVLPENGAVIVLPFHWTDIGTWPSVYEFFSKENKNYEDGEVIALDSSGSLIKGPAKKIIATIGIKNLIIVDTPDALLVCEKDRAGEIGRVLEELKQQKKEEYL